MIKSYVQGMYILATYVHVKYVFRITVLESYRKVLAYVYLMFSITDVNAGSSVEVRVRICIPQCIVKYLLLSEQHYDNSLKHAVSP